jgi:hypothetical protein
MNADKPTTLFLFFGGFFFGCAVPALARFAMESGPFTATPHATSFASAIWASLAMLAGISCCVIDLVWRTKGMGHGRD